MSGDCTDYVVENEKSYLNSDVQERATFTEWRYTFVKGSYMQKSGIYIDNEYNREGEQRKKPSNGDGKWIAQTLFYMSVAVPNMEIGIIFFCLKSKRIQVRWADKKG